MALCVWWGNVHLSVTTCKDHAPHATSCDVRTSRAPTARNATVAHAKMSGHRTSKLTTRTWHGWIFLFVWFVFLFFLAEPFVKRGVEREATVWTSVRVLGWYICHRIHRAVRCLSCEESMTRLARRRGKHNKFHHGSDLNWKGATFLMS